MSWMWLWLSKPRKVFGEHQNRCYMGVHPPQNGGIGYDPYASTGGRAGCYLATTLTGRRTFAVAAPQRPAARGSTQAPFSLVCLSVTWTGGIGVPFTLVWLDRDGFHWFRLVLLDWFYAPLHPLPLPFNTATPFFGPEMGHRHNM